MTNTNHKFEECKDPTCTECIVIAHEALHPKATVPEWEKEWSVIQEREYSDLVAKGMSTEYAQDVVDEHDRWFRSTLQEATREAYKAGKDSEREEVINFLEHMEQMAVIAKDLLFATEFRKQIDHMKQWQANEALNQ